eukprot:2409978-Rhodomonas_salina.2
MTRSSSALLVFLAHRKRHHTSAGRALAVSHESYVPFVVKAKDQFLKTVVHFKAIQFPKLHTEQSHNRPFTERAVRLRWRVDLPCRLG